MNSFGSMSILLFFIVSILMLFIVGIFAYKHEKKQSEKQAKLIVEASIRLLRLIFRTK